MKLAIFSDIHGNSYYFRACLSAMIEHQVDKYIFLGDAVGYMPYGVEVLDMLDSINAECLMGNHEAMVCKYFDYSKDKDAVYQLDQLRQNIPEPMLDTIKAWLPYKISSFNGLNILFVHGSPWDPLAGYIYPDSSTRFYNNVQYDFVFMGHSHRPFISKNLHTTLVSVGSVGLPRDFGDAPSFVIWNTAAPEPQIIRIRMNIQELLKDLAVHTVHNTVLACLNKNPYVSGLI